MIVLWKYRLWYLLLVVGAIALRIVLAIIRNRAGPWDPTSNELDLADLQKLVDRGQMSVEEFEKAKAVILSRRGQTSTGRAMGFPVIRPVERDQTKHS